MKNNIKGEFLSEYIEIVFPFTKKIFIRFPWVRQFINFSMVGVINLVLSYIIYAFLIYASVHYQIANQASFWLSVLNGYLLNKYWVFNKQNVKKSNSQSVRYFVVYLFNYFLGIFLMYLYVDILSLNKYIIPFISMPVTIPLNYCLNKFWVFKKPKI
jgi:putative flippase GtrA